MKPDPAIINTTLFASIGGGQPRDAAPQPHQPPRDCAASFAIQVGMAPRRFPRLVPGA